MSTLEGDGRALAAVATQFFINGAVVASYVPRLPAIRDRFDLDLASIAFEIAHRLIGADPKVSGHGLILRLRHVSNESMKDPAVKIAAHLHPQQASYAQIREAAIEAEELGVDIIYNWDHLYPLYGDCLLYTSPSPRDQRGSRMPSSA